MYWPTGFHWFLNDGFVTLVVGNWKTQKKNYNFATGLLIDHNSTGYFGAFRKGTDSYIIKGRHFNCNVWRCMKYGEGIDGKYVSVQKEVVIANKKILFRSIMNMLRKFV